MGFLILILYLVGKRMGKTAWSGDAQIAEILHDGESPGIYSREGLLDAACYEQDVALTLTKTELGSTNLE
ncbi:hypothetical protein E8E11_005003 [Didymella keratinophila]|nr:hypothetical protein E8E11_005003 [Didymella keratinophila]